MMIGNKLIKCGHVKNYSAPFPEKKVGLMNQAPTTKRQTAPFSRRNFGFDESSPSS
jgi:hypothetical protein